MNVTKELARQLEYCLKKSHEEVTRQYPTGKMLELSTGAAFFSTPESYLSQVVGWGFELKPNQLLQETNQIEAFYKQLGHKRIDIDICPYIGNKLPRFLSQRGYVVSELNNVSSINLMEYDIQPINDIEVKVMPIEELELWAKKAAIGFGCLDAHEQFLYYAHANNVTVFGAYENNDIVAGATIAQHGEVCDLGVATTLPKFRKKGWHKKLLLVRLNFAKTNGLKWASVTTEPGTVSDLNVQKIGFRCAYTRIKMTLFINNESLLAK